MFSSRSRRPRTTQRVAVLTAAVIAVATLTSLPAHAGDATLDPSKFRGVNWADPGDNFSNTAVVPSGLSTADDYAMTYDKAAAIAASFRDLGFNTLRLPVNPYSVGTAWGDSYAGAIDAATDLGLYVILSYWEGTGSNADGRVDDPSAWWAMWTTLVEDYADNDHVHFGLMNEPHGYNPSEWVDLAAEWLDTFPSLPRDRVFVSGHGYSENLSVVCYDSRLDGTYLALHNYAFWNTYAYDRWLEDYSERLAGCAGRAIVEEFGVPMTSGLDFNAPPAGSASAQNYIAFLRATTDLARSLNLGTVYWPGLRTGDSYSLTRLVGSGADLSLDVVNQSGLDRLVWAWGDGDEDGDGVTVVVRVPETGALALSLAAQQTELSEARLSADLQHLEASGVLPEVTVADTRLANPGWDVVAAVGDFSSSEGSIDGAALGIAPEVVSTSGGQSVTAGPVVAPGAGFVDGTVLGSAAAGAGRGTAVLGAELELHVPTDTPPGTYTAVITVTVL